MSLKLNGETEAVSAEANFRAAFIRLKTNLPIRLPQGTPVSQNNVAKEAGTDPSALRKSRFPTLIREIQEYIREVRAALPDVHRLKSQEEESKRELQRRLEDSIQQRDQLTNLLNAANAKILALTDRINELESKTPQRNAGLLSYGAKLELSR